MFYKQTSTTPSSEGYHRSTRTTSARPTRPTTQAKYETRRPPEKEMLFGIRAVMEAIDAGKTLDKVLIRRDMTSAIGRELTTKLEGTATSVQRVPVEKLNQFTDKNHQGVIAFLSPIEVYRIEDIVPTLFEQGKTPLLMVLDGITDVRNFGAIARTCACAGVDALIIGAYGSVALNGDAVKTSAGALHTLPVCKVDNLQDCLKFLASSGIRIIGASEHADHLYTQSDMTVPTAIVMGSEDKGIYSANLDLCTDLVRIPMSGTIESLNVSVAAGVMLYEAVRQRQ